MAITYDQRRPEIDDIIAIYQSSGIKRPFRMPTASARCTATPISSSPHGTAKSPSALPAR
ncbi:hypothetical protein HpSP79_18140 [Helicobacter pylori]